MAKPRQKHNSPSSLSNSYKEHDLMQEEKEEGMSRIILPKLDLRSIIDDAATEEQVVRVRARSVEDVYASPVTSARGNFSIDYLLCSPRSPVPSTPLVKYRDREEALVVKVTVDLLPLYTRIQNKIFTNPPPEVPDLRYDNEHFEYKLRHGEILGDKYKVLKALGKGTFGQVVQCVDIETNVEYALKVIKSHSSYTRQARREIEILMQIKEDDENDEYGLVRMTSYFVHCNHLCIVFELLSCSLYDLIKRSKSLSLPLIRKFAYQLLNSLYFLSIEGTDVIHSDLKPENILLRDSNRSGIKIIDFGSSCRSREQIFTYIQSRFYRAPEIILGMEYSHSIDMWSLGCILVELHTGDPLFPGENEIDQLHKIVQCTGIPPSIMLERCSKKSLYFNQSDNGLYSLKSHPECNQPEINLYHTLNASPSKGAISGNWVNKHGHGAKQYNNFVDLITRMLTCNPNDRIKPMEAIMHPFFTSEPNWCDESTYKYLEAGTPTAGKRKKSSILIPRDSRSPKKIRRKE